MRPEQLILRIRMSHTIQADSVVFHWTADRVGNNACDQLERELRRLVEEEVEFRLAVRQVNHEESMRDG